MSRLKYIVENNRVYKHIFVLLRMSNTLGSCMISILQNSNKLREVRGAIRLAVTPDRVKAQPAAFALFALATCQIPHSQCHRESDRDSLYLDIPSHNSRCTI